MLLTVNSISSYGPATATIFSAGNPKDRHWTIDCHWNYPEHRTMGTAMCTSPFLYTVLSQLHQIETGIVMGLGDKVECPHFILICEPILEKSILSCASAHSIPIALKPK